MVQEKLGKKIRFGHGETIRIRVPNERSSGDCSFDGGAGSLRRL